MARRKLTPPPPGIVFAYMRDSGGLTQDMSIQRQDGEITAWCAARGLTIIRRYVDARRPGSSTEERSEFLAMIDACTVNAPPVEAVVVWDLSRFSRDETDRALYPAMLARYGVKLLSVTQANIDGPVAGVVREAYALVDGEFLRRLSTNVKSGQRVTAQAGRVHASRVAVGYRAVRVQFGLRQDGKTPRVAQRLEVDPEMAPRVRAAFQLYADGVAVRQIHERTHIAAAWNSYSYIWQNALYTGRVRSCGVEWQDEALRIVDDATWLAVQTRRAHPRPPRSVNSQYLLSGLLRCECGEPMYGADYRSKGLRYYWCRGSKGMTVTCHNRTRVEAIEGPVLAAVLAHIGEPAWADALVAELRRMVEGDPGPQRLQNLQQLIKTAERARSNLLDLAEGSEPGALAEIRRRLAMREAELGALRAELAALPGAAAVLDEGAVREGLAELVAELGSGDVVRARLALGAVVARVVYGGGGVVVEYRLGLDVATQVVASKPN